MDRKIAEGPKFFQRIFLSKNFQPAAHASRTQDPETLRDGLGPEFQRAIHE
jgi:hypothetical protein